VPQANSKKTPSFICELPLVVSPMNEGILLSNLEAARQMYNACLFDAMRRVRLIRQSKNFTFARSLKPSNPKRQVLFKKAREQYNFSEYALHAYSTQIRNSWLSDHLDSNTAQKLATRAYNAATKVLFGLAKKVRFKGKNQMDSVEGKSNKSGIRWKDDCLIWGKLQLKALISKNDPVILHGLKSKIKYVRLVRRKISGKNRFYAQLVCQGNPFIKPKNVLGKGDVGLDIGPSTIAIVSSNKASLELFAAQLKGIEKEIRSLNRKIERSRRGNNPNNYNSNGTIKKGKQLWNNSKSYHKIKNRKADKETKLAAHRKSLHGQLVNSILSEGNVFKLEKLSYKALQKLYGKSVGKRAPGMFVAQLKRKAENAGGKIVDIPTQSTKLSQTCQCGRVKKKTLKERVHQCACGIVMQRDLYSAFLAKNIDPNTNSLQVSQLLNDWHSSELILWAAWRDATKVKPATGRLVPSSFGCCPEVEWVAAEVLQKVSKTLDVVGTAESQREDIHVQEPSRL
jgi:putative transposase